MIRRFEVDLDIPASAAWHAVAERFGDTGQWTSLLKRSWMVGDVAVGGQRVCELPNGSQAVERITQLDSVAMTLDYKLIRGGPVILKSAQNRWSVVSLGESRCKVAISPKVMLKWWALPMTPLLWLGLGRDLPRVMEEFKHWAENGTTHPRKHKKAA